MFNFRLSWLGVVIALLRTYVSDTVVEVIKTAIFEFVGHASDGWDPGELKSFVIEKGREITEASDTPVDDAMLELLVWAYLKWYEAKGRITIPPAPAPAV